ANTNNDNDNNDDMDNSNVNVNANVNANDNGNDDNNNGNDNDKANQWGGKHSYQKMREPKTKLLPNVGSLSMGAQTRALKLPVRQTCSKKPKTGHPANSCKCRSMTRAVMETRPTTTAPMKRRHIES
ncbi:hypothetical protein RFI_10143, partial [Reticulomyxa filosa]